MIGLTVVEWAAWAPVLHDRAAWQAWALAPAPPKGDALPELAEVPAMQRRRIDRMGRMAVQAACWCARAEADGVPLVFASRHGDLQRSLVLLEQLARGEAMSPTQFGLSVHNAIAALYSILRGERGNYLALAAGRSTAEAALVEAAGLLADGAGEVQVVVYEAELPEAYAGFGDEPDAGFAWSWRLRSCGDGVRIELGWEALEGGAWAAEGDGAAVAPALPASLEALRFLLSREPRRVHGADGLRWLWRRQGEGPGAAG